jgi:plasmid maintenance system antidote protein VapI
MESHPSQAGVNFDTLQIRLIALVNFRIRNGEFTERGLARMLHVSQPQMHNVLKGNRRLQWDLADELLRKFSVTIQDLINFEDQTHPAELEVTGFLGRQYNDSTLLASDVPSGVRGVPRKPPSSEPTLWPVRRRSV